MRSSAKRFAVCLAALLFLGCGAGDRVRALNAADVFADGAQVELDALYRDAHEDCLQLRETDAIEPCFVAVEKKHAPVRAAYRALAASWKAAASLHLALEAGQQVSAAQVADALLKVVAAQQALSEAIAQVKQ